MWNLNNSNLNVNYKENNTYRSNNVAVLKPNTTLTNAGYVCSILKNYENNIITVIDNNDNTYSFDVTEQLVIINTPERTFTNAIDYNNPQNGEFVYSDGKVKLYSDIKITTVNVLNATSGIKSLRLYNIPSFLYGLPIQGGFSISENFQDLPSANFVFITTRKNLYAYRAKFRTGSTVNIFKYYFTINNYSEEIKPDTQEVIVNIGLRGIQEKYINKPILLNNNPQNPYDNFTDPDCQVNAEITNNTNPEYISINTIASRAGTSLSGISFKVKVPADKADSSTTTIANELNKHLEIKQSFVDYNRNIVLVKNINNVTNWTFTQDDLTSSFTTSINSTPVNPINQTSTLPEEPIYDLNALVPDNITTQNNVVYSAENYSYIPTPTLMNVTTPNIFNSSGTVLKKEQTRNKEPKYELRTIKRKTYDKGDPDPHIYPDNISRLNSLDFNFDRSGTTKTQITVTEENGFPISEITTKWGFAYKASDIYVDEDKTLSGNPANWWQVIEKTYTTYTYDKNTGYLIGYDISGKRLLRYQVESDDLPTIELSNATTLDEEELLTYNSYKFEWIPIYGAKRYLLVQHRDYYTNFQSEERKIKKCLRDGNSTWIDNPLYIESMFALYESEEKQCFSSMRNPDNVGRESDDPIKPPLITGEETYNRNNLEILPSKNTSPGFYRDSSLPENDSYLTYTSNFSAQEPGFSTIVENTQISENSGIPSIHTKKDSAYELIQPKEEKDKETATYRYVIWTNPYTGNYPREGSVSYEEAENIRDVLNAVQFKLKIDDMRNSLSSSTSIPINLNISAGDICNFNINGLQYKRRVLGLTHNFIIDGLDNNGIPILIDGNTQLNLGLERSININYKQEKIPVAKPYKSNQDSITLTTKGFTLGSILPQKYRTRGNYYELPG